MKFFVSHLIFHLKSSNLNLFFYFKKKLISSRKIDWNASRHFRFNFFSTFAAVRVGGRGLTSRRGRNKLCGNSKKGENIKSWRYKKKCGAVTSPVTSENGGATAAILICCRRWKFKRRHFLLVRLQPAAHRNNHNGRRKKKRRGRSIKERGRKKPSKWNKQISHQLNAPKRTITTSKNRETALRDKNKEEKRPTVSGWWLPCCTFNIFLFLSLLFFLLLSWLALTSCFTGRRNYPTNCCSPATLLRRHLAMYLIRFKISRSFNPIGYVQISLSLVGDF